MLTKIATCCYCGSRTVLELRGKTRHELACAACGAPLRYLKMLPLASDRAGSRTSPSAQTTASVPQSAVKHKPRKQNLIKRFGRRLWDDLWDEVEDIFD